MAGRALMSSAVRSATALSAKVGRICAEIVASVASTDFPFFSEPLKIRIYRVADGVGRCWTALREPAGLCLGLLPIEGINAVRIRVVVRDPDAHGRRCTLNPGVPNAVSVTRPPVAERQTRF